MNRHIPLKWTDKERKYFSKPIPRVEQIGWLDRIFDTIDDWFMWVVVAFMAGASIWIFIKIYQLSRISMYIKSIK